MVSAARRQIIGGGPINKSRRWRRPQIVGGAAGARLYAPAWWGCASAADRERVDRFLRKLHRAGYSHKVNFHDLIKPAEKKLLCKVKNNEYHVLRPLFPPFPRTKSSQFCSSPQRR